MIASEKQVVHMSVNACLLLAGGLIKQTTAAADWSVHLQRTARSQGAHSTLHCIVGTCFLGVAGGVAACLPLCLLPSPGDTTLSRELILTTADL